MTTHPTAPPALDERMRALEDCADAAMLAPSVHASQPWTIVLHRDRLELRADRARQLPDQDPACAADRARWRPAGDPSGVDRFTVDDETGADRTFVLLATPRDDPPAWLRAGEALERVLLELHRLGWAASPMSQALEVP